ncbi:MAG: hypothetical protein ACRYG2_25865 [Janthinobacterium lividum]
MSFHVSTATLFVDPQCPFAWITYRWLRLVEDSGAVDLDVQLMSLACVNEHQELDPGHRAYNEDAWAAGRVGAALLASPHAARWPAFYDTFGRRRHVDGVRDNLANIAASLRDLDLPADLGRAAADRAWDADLRARTTLAVTGVDGPGGTPITRIGARAYFGPVLTSVPPADEAVDLWRSLSRLSAISGFASIATRRDDHLDTGSRTAPRPLTAKAHEAASVSSVSTAGSHP